MGLLSDIKAMAKSQYAQGAPYRAAVGGLLSGDTAPMAGLLNQKTFVSPMTSKEGLELALDYAPMGLGMVKKIAPEFLYHGTTPEAAAAIEKSGFDLSKSADGTAWFTSNPNIGEVAATGKGGVIKRTYDPSSMKLGTWDDLDRYSVDELIRDGFDGVKLVDEGETTYQIFNPQKLKKVK
jgi:hypothetical protein